MELLGLGFHAWFTIVTILTLFGFLLFSKIPADILFFGAFAALLVSGTLPTEDALSGLNDSTVVIIGVLFIVIAGLENTGVIQWITRHLLGTPKSFSKAIIKLMIPVGLLSSFLSNTTVVALFVNVVKNWSKKLNLSPSRLLIPLSYASCLGGVCTLIGTPPNLLIAGLYTDVTGVSLHIFTTTLAGLCCLAIGTISFIALRKLLPDRQSPDDSIKNLSDFTVELLVPSTCPLVGKTIGESGIRDFKGGYLFEIIRFDKEIVCPVKSDEFIMGGDRLLFTGTIESILELRDTHGFVNANHHIYDISEISEKRKLQTAYLTFRSNFLNKRMRDLDFEKKHNTVLVAVSREGKIIKESPRYIYLQAGDTLLFEGNELNSNELKGNLHFFDSDITAQTDKKTVLSALIMITMIVLSAFKIVPLLQSCFMAAIAMLVTRCCSIEQARKSINWEVLMVFAGSISLGKAIDNSGLAEIIASSLMNICGTNPIVVMIAICFVGLIITELISNTATAAILFPIAYQSAITLGVNPLTFSVALMFIASFGFASPVGSPTHLLVYTPGGYKFTDFIKIGFILDIIMFIATIFIVLVLFPL